MATLMQPGGEVLDSRYRLERELGSGGMATVFLAQDLRHPRQVVVKLLHRREAAVDPTWPMVVSVLR